MKIAKPFTIGALMLGTSFSAYAEHPGKQLHEQANCMKCHTSKPYDPSKTPTFERLVKAVTFCNENLNAGMFGDEIEQLADYINQEYYKHPK